MKHLVLLLVHLFLYIASAQAQLPIKKLTGAEVEAYEPENKSALYKMISDRDFPGKDLQSFGRFIDEMTGYKTGTPQQLVANWNYVDASGNLYDDVGRAHSITIDTINSGRFYICTPHSGVWKTTNNGSSYTPITEMLPTQNTSCLVIDPTNTDVLYLSTGTHEMDMPRNSIGIYKSTDAGITWNSTGLTFSASSAMAIGEMIINPKNNASLLAATSDGLYRTYDSGNSWTKILNDDVNSIRFKPGDTTIIYVTGAQLYRSNNSGATFIPITNGLINTFQWRYQNYVRTIAAYPDIIYFISAGLFVNPTFNPRMYIHKSVDSGNTFTVLDSLLGEVAVQVDVSQNTPDKFVAGYRNTFKKENAATPFMPLTQWNYPQLPFYMHADQRGISFDPRNDSTIYFCNDGGLYRMINNINNSINITGNMQLAHLYHFASSSISNYKILVASLDVYPYIIGPLGISQTFPQLVEAFAVQMSPLNDNIYSMAMYNPVFTVNNGGNFYTSSHPLIGGGFTTPDNFHYSECDTNICYFGSFNDIYKSTDYGLTFGYHVKTTYNPFNTFLKQPEGFMIPRSNPGYIYVYYIDSVFVTTDGTSNFTNVSAGLPIGLAAISSMAVDPVDENKAWVAFSGYSAGNKVFYTSNAGLTWTNVSAGLPNVPVNALVCQKGIPGAVYAGTDGGVFYMDNSFSTWQYYNTNLPNTMVTDLDIQYNLGKIRAATFGRGVWESDLFLPTPLNYVLPPVALFSAATTHACVGEPVAFNASPCGDVDSVSWIFPGGSPASSSLTNPSVTYTASGTYAVTMIAYNQGGSDTLTQVNYIEISTPLALPYYEPVGDLNAFVLPPGSYTTEVNFDGVTWNRGWWTDGSSGTGDDFIYYDNFYNNLNGQEERLVFPSIDLSLSIEPKLFFYRSYQRRDGTFNDTLKIYVKPCGGNEVTAYVKGGGQLANIPGFNSVNYWIPTQPSDWQLDSVDLTPFAGQEVVISFSDKGHGGQLLYIDEFRVLETNTTGLNEIPAAAAIHIFPNPSHSVINIRNDRDFSTPITITDLTGRRLIQVPSTGRDAMIDISSLANGFYFLEVNGISKKIQKISTFETSDK